MNCSAKDRFSSKRHEIMHAASLPLAYAALMIPDDKERTPMKQDFKTILMTQLSRYPLMTEEDCAKLIYQSEYGPGHMLPSREEAASSILAELADMPEKVSPSCPERISDVLCRFPLSSVKDSIDAELLAGLMKLSTGSCKAVPWGVSEKLSLVRELPEFKSSAWLEEWERDGFPAVHHSRAFSEAYAPAYRLILCEYAAAFRALSLIMHRLSDTGRLTVSVEGDCCAGKSTFASLISSLMPCRIVHMDDFYLSPGLRKKNWREIPGENMDFERFNKEVASGIRSGEEIRYRPYMCGTGAFGEEKLLPESRLTVVEGSYCRHPAVLLDYDVNILVTCGKAAQKERLLKRETSEMLEKLWIPLEESYEKLYSVRSSSDCILKTDIDCL